MNLKKKSSLLTYSTHYSLFEQSLLEFNARIKILENIQHFIRFLWVNSTSSSDIYNIIIQLVQVGHQAVALELSLGLAGPPKGPEVSIGAAHVVGHQCEGVVLIFGTL